MDAREASSDSQADIRDRLALVLDVEDLAAALQLARRLRGWFGVVKVGLELFTAAGPVAVESLTGEGFAVFLDLKLHDIPNTAGRAASRARQLGATYLTAHTAGGAAMLRAASESFGGGAGDGGGVLGVTILTSDQEAPASLLASRVGLAVEAGCAGVVCAAADLPVVRGQAASILTAVPGIRLASASRDDQARVSTPAGAIASGASLLVIGRTVTAATDPESAAEAVSAEVRAALGQL